MKKMNTQINHKKEKWEESGDMVTEEKGKAPELPFQSLRFFFSSVFGSLVLFQFLNYFFKCCQDDKHLKISVL